MAPSSEAITVARRDFIFIVKSCGQLPKPKMSHACVLAKEYYMDVQVRLARKPVKQDLSRCLKLQKLREWIHTKMSGMTLDPISVIY